MIKQIKLKDYILIDELEANFHGGLNVITGETGAGKSIMINAIDIAFSPRVSKEVIKNGREKAVIELTLEHNGAEIILSKEIAKSGARTRLDGVIVNQDEVKEFRAKFLDIHSQHQTYTFLQPKYHITLLDNYAKSSYGGKLAEYRSKYDEYRRLSAALDNLQNAANATESQIEFLQFQVNEIAEAEIAGADEDEALKAELEVLENAEKLKELTGTSYWAINGDDGSIMEALGKIKQNISKAASFDPQLVPLEQQLIGAVENLRETGNDLRNYSQKLDNDTERLNQIQERIFLLDKLKRKYGGGVNISGKSSSLSSNGNSLQAVLETFDKLSAELSSIEFSTKNIEELEGKILATRAELQTAAAEISENRKNYAQVLSSLIQDKLEKLELPKVRFKIDVRSTRHSEGGTTEETQKGSSLVLRTTDGLNADGIDDVEFMLAANISDDLKPLARVASGGEISRVMLALKSIFAESDEIDTVIFDEIDTGISGRASQSVADEIVELSKYHQVILITHQAIIASKADKHFYVKKSQLDQTKVEVYVLTDENRIKALAELAGGDINEQSMDFARSLVG